jgi:glutaredoxin
MSQPHILLYATKSCPHCATARAAIEAARATYEERDPSANPAVLREMLTCSAAAVVPTIVVGGRALVGFDADRFAQMLREEPLVLDSADDYTEEELSGAEDESPITG